MFFCIGENHNKSCSAACGVTVEEAIQMWSTSKDVWSDIIEEFKMYNPRVIEGTELCVELEIPKPIVKIS